MSVKAKGNKKILVTGATGFIGRRVVYELVERGYNVHAFARHPFNLDNLPASLQEKISSSCGDIRSYEDVELAAQSCQAVVHLAGALRYSNYKYNYDVHVQGTENIVRACQNRKIKRIIAYSSATALWKNPGRYGLTKKMSEDVLFANGLDITIFRPTIVLGEGSKVMSTLVHQIRAYPFLVPLVGRGKVLRQPVWLDDLVPLTANILWNKKSYGKTYNIGGKDSILFRDLVKEICVGLKMHKILVPLPPQFIKGFAFLLEHLYERPPFTVENVRNATINEQVDIKPAQHDLGFSPAPLSIVLKQVLKEQR